MPWSLEEFVSPLYKLTDSLEPDLTELNHNIMAIDYDRMIDINIPKSPVPCSVDGICITEDTVYYIEFKAQNIKLDEELRLKYRHKASESPLIFEKHFPELHGFRKEFILVLQDAAGKIVASSTKQDYGQLPLPEPLDIFRKQDRFDHPVFYDEMRCLTCKGFVKVANRKLIKSRIPI